MCCMVVFGKTITHIFKYNMVYIQGDALCKECFYAVFESEVHETILRNKLFKRGELVAIGASGGKGWSEHLYILIN